MVLISKKGLRQLKNYLLVGMTAFVVEYVTFMVLEGIVNSSLYVAQSISFLLGLAISFLGSRYITFKVANNNEHTLRFGAQTVAFLGLGAFNLVASNIAIYVFVDLLGVPAFISKVIVMGFIVVWNYAVFNKIIFKVK